MYDNYKKILEKENSSCKTSRGECVGGKARKPVWLKAVGVG